MQPNYPGYNIPPSLPQPKQPNYLRIILLLIVGGILLLVLLSFALTSFIVSDVMSRSNEQLQSIAMTSSTEGWAIGTSTGLSPMRFGGVAYHYTGGQWTRVPISATGLMFGIAMVSPDEGWAVGESDIIHYHNGEWTKAPNVGSLGQGLHSVYMISANEGWAVGDVIMHYKDGKWATESSSSRRGLQSVYMLSATDGWAVGDSILHYTGGQWADVSKPVTATLNSVYMVSPTEGWAVGGVSMYNDYSSVILHYQGGKWMKADDPADIPLKSVYMASANEGWAVGGGFYKKPGDAHDQQYSVIVHYKDGKWQVADKQTHGELDSVYMTSPNDGWAVGEAILHYTGGQWQSVRQLGLAAQP